MNETELPGSMNLAFVEEMYAAYLHDPTTVSAEWRRYFEGLSSDNGATAQSETSTLQDGPSFRPASLFHTNGVSTPRSTPNSNGTATNGAVTKATPPDSTATIGTTNGVA